MDKILLIDDDEVDRMAIKRILEDKFEIVEAENGNDALKLLKEVSFDLIILDYMLKDTDGFSLFEVMREIISIPVIIVTGQGDEELAVKFVKAGAFDYIPKNKISPEFLIKVSKIIKEEKVDFQEFQKAKKKIKNLISEYSQSQELNL